MSRISYSGKMLLAISMVLLAIPAMGCAQSLSYSRVILLPKNVSDTVPAGKVWKVETWTFETEDCGTYNGRPAVLQLNGTNHHLSACMRNGNGSIYTSENRGPLWIPAGTIVLPLDPGGCLQAVSIIEFNEIP